MLGGKLQVISVNLKDPMPGSKGATAAGKGAHTPRLPVKEPSCATAPAHTGGKE